MSKQPSHPIILKKDDSKRPPRTQVHQPIQPKILTKANNKENTPSAVPLKKVSEPEGHLAPPVMKTCQRMMSPHFQIDHKILEYLDSDNSDFLVVGIVGHKNVGKSTLMNIIASPDFLKISDDSSVTFRLKHEVFPINGVAYEGNTIDMFITTDRIIFLDTSPLLANVQRRDMIVSECDDIKLMLMMIQLCHLILVVHDSFPHVSVARLLHVADQMVPNEMKHRPVTVYIGNRVQPGAKVLHINTKVHNGVNLVVPDLNHSAAGLHYDLPQVIQDLQEKVFMMKRWSMMDNDDEVFTEKKWGQRLLQVVEQMKADYFLRKYEAFRDKFHQPIENC